MRPVSLIVLLTLVLAGAAQEKRPLTLYLESTFSAISLQKTTNTNLLKGYDDLPMYFDSFNPAYSFIYTSHEEGGEINGDSSVSQHFSGKIYLSTSGYISILD